MAEEKKLLNMKGSTILNTTSHRLSVFRLKSIPDKVGTRNLASLKLCYIELFFLMFKTIPVKFLNRNISLRLGFSLSPIIRLG